MLRAPITIRFVAVSVLSVLMVWLLPAPVFAVQEHGPPEGIYLHQGAHLFFVASMVLLVYWLRQRRLVRDAGWRYIQYAALFFILWNIDAFTAHFLDEQADILDALPAGFGKLRIETGDYPVALAWFYYFAKLDHLLCVPAMVFLYAGLRRLVKDAGQARGGPRLP